MQQGNLIAVEIKINEEPFNKCPGRDTIMESLAGYGILDASMSMDLEGKEHFKYQNDKDNLVLAFSARASIDLGLNLAKFAIDNQADELEFMRVVGFPKPESTEEGIQYVIVRIWWD